MLFSICIPAYNRPEKLMELLKSIDTEYLRIEIIICEDNSPKQLSIRKIVKDFKKNSKLLNSFAELDDSDIITCLKYWRYSEDFVLSNISKRILDRNLLKIKIPNLSKLL